MQDYIKKLNLVERLLDVMRKEDLNVTDLSNFIGVTRPVLYALLNGKKLSLKSVFKIDKWLSNRNEEKSISIKLL